MFLKRRPQFPLSNQKRNFKLVPYVQLYFHNNRAAKLWKGRDEVI